jgi:predicted membrane channel-forming protein YqfA (hemolysin III family)
MVSITVTATEMSATRFWPNDAQSWVFIAGIPVIIFIAVAAVTPDPAYRFSPRRKKRDATVKARTIYWASLLTWLCVVNFLEFRRGLETRLGLPDAITWAFAPIGVIVLIALTIIPLAIDDERPWWKYTIALALYYAAVAGYLAVTLHYGLSAFLK